MINVTKTFLPPQSEYDILLKRAWDIGWITNRGILTQELEDKLKHYLNVPNILVTTNGTLPLQISIKTLGLVGEIITTPFSYVATTSSIVWEGCTPIFVDIHPEYLTIDSTKIEAAITGNTTAILATHVFGNPCDIEGIEQIAKKYNLSVIYDAAHCFGVSYKGKSIFEYGDISTCSFHATKLFHTGEGGALFTNDYQLFNKLYYHHNFGHKDLYSFCGLGLNAKMSELQAAMGLAVLPYMKTILTYRKKIVELYLDNLENITFLKLRDNTEWNYSYFPILFESEKRLIIIVKLLNKENIFPRRYFYPSLNTLPYVHHSFCPISEASASRVLCLPLYHNLSEKVVIKICTIINKTL